MAKALPQKTRICVFVGSALGTALTFSLWGRLVDPIELVAASLLLPPEVCRGYLFPFMAEFPADFETCLTIDFPLRCGKF